MDNYYTSPEVAVALAERRVYIRGDMQSKQGRFSTAAIQSNGRQKVTGGTHKMVSDKNMVLLLWWIDGNPVHFLDGGWNGSK
jgi:hypothetical protein